MPQRPERTDAAILDPAKARRVIDVGRADPPASLRRHVDYLWWVSWNAPTPYRAEVIPRPVVHLSAEYVDGVPRLRVHGIYRRRFWRQLDGAGRTVAAAFRPGCFRPFTDVSVSTLRDRDVLAAELLGPDDAPVAAALLDRSVSPTEASALLGDWVAALDRAADPTAQEVATLVERADSDPAITRVEHLAALAGVSVRTLQRQFLDRVGVGPKWVVQRSRLLDVAAAAHADAPVDWAALAAELGYADQPHLIRAFTALVGRPPASYAAQQTARPRA